MTQVVAIETHITAARKIPGAKIAAYLVDGREFVLNYRFAHRDDPNLFATLEKIRAGGVINLTYWRPARKGEC